MYGLWQGDFQREGIMEIRTLFPCNHSEWVLLENVNSCRCSICEPSLKVKSNLKQGVDSGKTLCLDLPVRTSTLENNKGQDKAEWLARMESALPSCYPALLQLKIERICIC